jgi:hypothetical protein
VNVALPGCWANPKTYVSAQFVWILIRAQAL